MKKQKIFVTGNIPPPIGGVTVFIQYFLKACESQGVSAELFKFNLQKIGRYKSAYLHINYSNNLKRLLYLIIGKMFFKRVFFVKHGGPFDLSNLLVRLSLYFTDGVFCLNSEVERQLASLGIKKLKHSTIFRENQSEIVNRSEQIKSKRSRLLFYINNDSKINGKSIYGTDFILECMSHIDKSFFLTVIDLSGKYEASFAKYSNVKYIGHSVSFKDILMETDVYIRPTLSDGMSVALLEAGLMGVRCLASNVVERPSFTMTFSLTDKNEFFSCLDQILESQLDYEVELSSVNEVLDFMSLDT